MCLSIRWSMWSALACAAAVLAVGGTASADEVAGTANISCPDLYVLGVQGTSESSSAADPSAISGMIGTVFGPMLAQEGVIGHATIPYPAGFGGAPGTGPSTESFAASVTEAGDRLDAAAADVVARCPETRIAVAAYSQGAGGAADFARRVGAGQGPVNSDQVAGVALLSDWTRPYGPDPIPGRPGQTSPDPVPGTDGAATTQIHFGPVPASGGIGSESEGFGDLTGRVAEICTPGDLSCDAPENAQAFRAAAGLAAQADLRDPISAAHSLGEAWSSAASKASTTVVLDDLHVDQGQVNLVPAESLSERVADAADPREPMPTSDQQQAVAAKFGEAVAAVVTDPAQIPRLAGQVGAAIAANLADNAALADPATWARIATTVAAHTSYAANGASQQVADWFASAARDLALGEGGSQ
ncbi:cutinase family protein [Nocardia blacklockiae]|uniref:cutinase family protein n=1 Tax=Nocardia blacklockiae TaxID=480036 RepID=UPI001893078A|nr:cutinase family protein [Nocardia blacklockiae]MBF6171149.1 cutinase family protein [Nocardia blacklockiae]